MEGRETAQEIHYLKIRVFTFQLFYSPGGKKGLQETYDTTQFGQFHNAYSMHLNFNFTNLTYSFLICLTCSGFGFHFC